MLVIPKDSYVSLDDADNYHRLRNSFEQWQALTEEQKQRRLVSASDFLDHHYYFSGEKADLTQPRAFPRDKSGQIPPNICKAVCELALQADLNQNSAQKMSSVKVGPVSVSYDDQSGVERQANRFEYVRSLLSDYLDTKSSFGQVRLQRG
ncbi:DnaT-like ssDNA-binding protein [Ursidibacter arcticus]